MAMSMNPPAQFRSRVKLRKTGGSNIMTIPKEIMIQLPEVESFVASMTDNGDIVLTPERNRPEIDVLEALNGLDRETVLRMASDSGIDDTPVGREHW